MNGRRARLWIELVALYAGLPALLYVRRLEASRMVIPILLVMATLMWIALRYDRRFDGRRPWRIDEPRRHLRAMMLRFVPPALVVGVMFAWWEPQRLFLLPRRDLALWLLVMIAYPLLSVVPQGIIFRVFLFHRYHELLGRRGAIVISGLAFGLAHAFFANWIAPTLATLGGLVFALTYAQTRSLLLSALEHALWGNFLFTLGLGWYFYGGSVQ